MTRVFHRKIVLVGDTGVGKTSIRRNYMGLSFERNHVSTLGADFALKKVDVFGDRVDMQIWDLGGQEGYGSLRSRYFSGANGAILVFDLTDLTSFLNIPIWIDEMWIRTAQRDRIPIVLLGNKCDLDDLQIQKSTVLNFIEDFSRKNKIQNLNIQYYETSAKDGINITQAFETIAIQLYDFLLEELGLESSQPS